MLRLNRLLIPAALGGLLLLGAARASAQMSIPSPYPFYSPSGSGRVVVPQPFSTTQANAGINRADCFDKEKKIVLRLAGVPANTTDIRILARRDATSCADPTNRRVAGGTGSNVQCWQVARWSYDQVINKEVSFLPLEVIAAVEKQLDIETGTALDVDEICSRDGSMPPTEIYLQVMAFNGNTPVGWTSAGGSTGVVTPIHTIYDLAGPNPPTNVTAGSGNTMLVAKFDSIATPTTDFKGFRAFCYKVGSTATPTPAPATKDSHDGGVDDARSTDATSDALTDDSAVDDAATTDDATTEDAGATQNDCPSGHPFVEGEMPTSAIEALRCADEASSASGKITITGLDNNQQYVIAIAATDQQGNSGVLSNVACATPKETDDFFTVYRKSGGQGGGGWCAIGQPGSASSFGLFGLVLAVAGAARLARRSRR